MNGWKKTFADALSQATRVAGAALMLALIGVLVWALSLSGWWYLPAGGAVAGGLIGWKNPSFRSGRVDVTLTYVVRGAVLGLAIVVLYQSGCTSVPQDPRGQDPKRETLVEPPSPENP
ncbi:MAG: hypothetical protein ABEL04_08405 [Salinibacter sp.]|uniref:hypothetical protein n=1 Tax=Salinibacter sp. TaxID=2065818 RepID=UPI0035D4934E